MVRPMGPEDYVSAKQSDEWFAAQKEELIKAKAECNSALISEILQEMIEMQDAFLERLRQHQPGDSQAVFLADIEEIKKRFPRIQELISSKS
jgi:hypothetical protein